MWSRRGLARVFAPAWFVLVDEEDEEQVSFGLLGSDPLTLESGTVLPVFTSLESAEDFAGIYYAVDRPVRPLIGQVDAFLLRVWCDGAGLEAFAFDPGSDSPGRWTAPRETVSVGHYRRFATELNRGLEKLVARAEVALGREPRDHEDAMRMRAWCMSRVEEAIQDAHARAGEWEERAGTQPGL